MRRLLVLFLFASTVWSCVSGPIYLATKQEEGIRTDYQDRSLKGLYERHREELSELFRTFEEKGVGVYKEGLGYTVLTDDGRRAFYLFVYLRPKEIVFDKHSTRPEERLSTVLTRHLGKYVDLLPRASLSEEVDGVALGLFWPVRDFSQCKNYGGFIEYVIVQLEKGDLLDVWEGKRDLFEVLREREVRTSLDMQEEKSIRVSF